MNSEMLEKSVPHAKPETQNPIPPINVLFVCLGNICRSPSAQGIFSYLANKRQGPVTFIVDSAGTHDYHIGNPPDPRAIQAARKAGVDISHKRARQIRSKDFADFDHIFVMDERNWRSLMAICPPEHVNKIRPTISLLDQTNFNGVPDPFHGDTDDFDSMVQLLFGVCEATLNELEQQGQG